MPDTTPGPRPSGPVAVPGGSAPPSVRYAQVLLFVQGGIWGWGAMGGMLVAAEALAGILSGLHGALIAVVIGLSAVAGGMAVVKMRLAARLDRGRSQRVRRTVITVELGITACGVLSILTPYTGPVADLAGFGGACLSLAAALVLMRRRARQYAESGAVHAEVTDRGPASGPASFWWQSALA